jgi:hypothetical protein
MAVGDYLFDGAKPPPELARALNYEKWGIGDIMRLPAGLLPTMNVCLNYYHAIASYQSAVKTTEWSRKNPQAWNLVSWVIAQRRERKHGNRHQ